MTSKKLSGFTAWYLRLYLSSDFDKQGLLSQDISDRLCINSTYDTLQNLNTGCQSHSGHIRPVKVKKGLTIPRLTPSPPPQAGNRLLSKIKSFIKVFYCDRKIKDWVRKPPPHPWSMQRSRSPASLITLATWLKIRLWLWGVGGGSEPGSDPKWVASSSVWRQERGHSLSVGTWGEGNKCPNSHNQDEVLFIVTVPHEMCWVYVVFEHLIYCAAVIFST